MYHDFPMCILRFPCKWQTNVSKLTRKSKYVTNMYMYILKHALLFTTVGIY